MFGGSSDATRVPLARNRLRGLPSRLCQSTGSCGRLRGEAASARRSTRCPVLIGRDVPSVLPRSTADGSAAFILEGGFAGVGSGRLQCRQRTVLRYVRIPAPASACRIPFRGIPSHPSRLTSVQIDWGVIKRITRAPTRKSTGPHRRTRTPPSGITYRNSKAFRNRHIGRNPHHTTGPYKSPCAETPLALARLTSE